MVLKEKRKKVSAAVIKTYLGYCWKTSLLLHPVLLWWRWVHLCTASFDASSEGALSCSQTFHQLMSKALCRLPIPQRRLSPASGWGQTALDWAWRCVGWVKTACSLWSLYANYLQILSETAPGDISKCGACVAASAAALLLVMKKTAGSEVACFHSHVAPRCHHTAPFS